MTASGSTGTHMDVAGVTEVDCRDRCSQQSWCVAFEYTFSERKCELHSESITLPEVQSDGTFCSLHEIVDCPATFALPTFCILRSCRKM